MSNNQPLLECVPNISYGNSDHVLIDIIQTLNNIPKQKLLHVDSNLSANRTVFTFAGDPDAVLKAAFEFIRIAARHIDMRTQIGEHPRIGAIDVCPLIPLNGMDMEEVVGYSIQLAKKVGEELKIPVYLYEYSSKLPFRKTLPQIRKGGYEGLFEKMKDPEWQADFGPSLTKETFLSIAKTGATVIGARNILIAFNISLKSKDKFLAEQIAQKIRSSGYWEKDLLTNKVVKKKGMFPKLRAIGWYMEDFGTAQVSMNFLDYKITSPLIVWDKVRKIAENLNCEVLGCELVGLIPEVCLLEAGIKHLEETQKKAESFSKYEIVEAGIHYFKLNQIKPFDPQKQVLEYVLKNAGLLC